MPPATPKIWVEFSYDASARRPVPLQDVKDDVLVPLVQCEIYPGAAARDVHKHMAQVASELVSRPEGRRGIRLFRFDNDIRRLPPKNDGPLSDDNIVEIFRTGRAPMLFVGWWMGALGMVLRAHGIRGLDMACINAEANFGIDNFDKPLAQRILGDQAILAKMPPAVASNVAFYEKPWTKEYGDLRKGWQEYAASLVMPEMRNCLHRLGLPLRRVVDVGHSARAYSWFDNNNNAAPPLTGGRLLYGASCPYVYLTGDGNRYNGNSGKRAKDRVWNVFLDAITDCRNAVTAGTPTVPWIGNVRHNAFLFRQLCLHMGRLGIVEVGYWPEWQDAADLTFAAKCVREAMPAPGKPGGADLKPVPIDADSVTTRDITTTYEQYLDAEARKKP